MYVMKSLSRDFFVKVIAFICIALTVCRIYEMHVNSFMLVFIISFLRTKKILLLRIKHDDAKLTENAATFNYIIICKIMAVQKK